MRKRILLFLPVLCILLSLFSSAFAEGIGNLQIRNQEYHNNTLAFNIALSGTSAPQGQFAVCVYGESGQMKDTAFYPAKATVKASLGNVAETDFVKVAWLDDSFRLMAEPVSLKANIGAVADYAQFTNDMLKMLDRYGDAGAESDDPDNPYALSRIIVRCDSLPNLDDWHVLASVQGPDGLYVLQFQTPKQAEDCAEHLLTYPSVVYAVPDAVTQMDEPSAESLATLADSGRHLSWGVEATGIGPYVEALKSKSVTESVTVAVVDSGIDMDHPFLAGKYLSGYDYVENDSVPQDEFKHGTHVAGIVADCTAGLDVNILPVRVLDRDGRCPTLVWITNGIRYAVDHGADVINLSLSAPVSKHIDYEVQYAVSQNVTVVVAAGNQAGDTASRSPAHLTECITVSAVNEAKKTLPHSNYGDAVDLAAPGERVLSAVPRGKGVGYSDRNYDYMSGTSMAAPHVSAAAALLLCDRGRGQTPAQISETLRNAAQDLGTSGWDRKFGAGMLNLRPFVQPVVTFNANGGTGTMEPQSMEYGTAAALRKNTFTRNGYAFTGWNTEADGTGKHYADGASLSTEENLTLYAQWEENAVAYAILYSDGELVFQTSRTPASGRTAVQTYPVAVTGGEYCGWYDQRDSIQKVTIAEKIQPKSTALWFYDCGNLAVVEGLENLDTSSVTNMCQMFARCGRMTELDLTGFDTAKVTNMGQMFQDCAALKTIYASDKFVTSAATSSRDMFYGCTAIVGGSGTKYDSGHTDKAYAHIDGGVSAPGYFTDPNAEPTAQIFAVLYDDGELVFQRGNKPKSGKTLTKTYVVDLNAIYTWDSQTDTADTPWYNELESIHVINFADRITPTATAYWFFRCENLEHVDNIHNLDTAKVTLMKQMFYGCSKLTTLDVSHFDTSNVTTMKSMFCNCSGLMELDVSHFNTSNVTDMSSMFEGCSGLTVLDVSHFDTSNVTTMYWMFYGCSGLTELNVSKFGTSNVTNMRSMFYNCSKLTGLDVSHFDTSNVTTMRSMFFGCSGLTSLDVSHFDTANVTDMTSLFAKCRGLTALDVSHFDTANVITMQSMFAYCSGLTVLDVSHFDTVNVTSMNSMFGYCRRLTALDVSQFDTTNVTDIYCMFIDCEGLTALDVSHFNTVSVTDMRGMFSGCSSLRELDVSNFDTTSVTEVTELFWGCSGLQTLDMSHFETTNVTDMNGIFYGCSGLATLDVSHFDTSNVTTMEKMFNGCSGLAALDVSNFDTSNVTTMENMFNGCSGLAVLDVSHFDTSNVTTMRSMFNGCSRLTMLDVSKFNTANVTSMYFMFTNCSGLTTLDVSHFDTGNVTSMSWMFNDCSGLKTLDVSCFETANVKSMTCMFDGCSGLTVLDLSHFDTAKVTSMSYLLRGCSGLTALNVSNFNTAKVEDMECMFSGCSNLKTIYASDKFTTVSVPETGDNNSFNMFKDCTALVGGNDTEFDSNHTDKAYARIDGGPSAPGYFTAK